MAVGGCQVNILNARGGALVFDKLLRGSGCPGEGVEVCDACNDWGVKGEANAICTDEEGLVLGVVFGTAAFGVDAVGAIAVQEAAITL